MRSKSDAEFLEEGLTPAAVGAVKLTDWPNEPSLQTLKEDLSGAKPAHDAQIAKINEWNDLMYVRGKEKPKPVKGRSSIQPKLIRRQAEWRYSALTEPFLSSQKLIKVEPETAEDVQAAKQNELVLNYQFRTKINRVKFIDDLVRSVVDDGTGIIQTGWHRSSVLVPTEVPVFSYFPIQTEEQAAMLQQAIQLKQENPRGFDEQALEELKASVKFYEENGQPVIAQITGTTTVEKEVMLENHPTAVIHHPENVVIDPTCGGDLDKALFVVVSFETNKADLEKQGDRYKNLDAIDWQNAGPVNDPDHETRTPQDFQFKDVARRKAVAYEYWGFYDIHGTGELKPIVATWVGNTLIRMEESPFSDGKLPFVVVPYLPVKRELYGEPDAELLSDQQKISGALMRGMLDLLGRSANSQQGIAKGLLDPLNKRRFDNGEDYEFNPQSGNPQSHIIEHKYPELPASAINMLMIQNQEAEALTGVKSFSGGLSGDAYGDVAAGVRSMLDAASKREMAILRRIAQGIRDIARKFIAMNAEFLSEEETVRITNGEFVQVRREDLKGSFDLIVDIATAEVDNAKAQDLSFMHQTMGPNMDPSISVNLILAEIAELKRMPELAQKLRVWKPTPSPEQQQMAQLELQLKQAELEKTLAEIEKLRAEAGKTSAETDKTVLDHVEQETGTKHARDLEKQQAQANGNQALQVTKALTSPIKEGEKIPNINAAIGYNALSDKMNDAGTVQDPRLNIRSMYYDPKLDPATNPALNNL